MASKKRQFAKKRKLPSKTYEQDRLYKETLKQVRKVNEKLDSLERRYKSGTWSSKKLSNRLDSANLKAWSKGRIRIPKNVTQTQLIAIQKASKLFLESKTSTKAGIKSVSKSTIESIQKSLSTDKPISINDAESFYSMLKDVDFNYFSDKIGSSTMWALIDDAIEQDQNQNQFINMLKNYIDFNDSDISAKAKMLYDKYVIG